MSVHAVGHPQGERAPPEAARRRALVPADAPLREELAQLRAAAALRQDDVADTDLAIETLRLALQDFAARYGEAVAEERRALARVQSLLAHVGRWLRLLDDDETPWGATLAERNALHRVRDAELRAWRRERDAARVRDANVNDATCDDAVDVAAEENAPDAAEARAAAAEAAATAPSWHARREHDAARLKQAFRTLARRYHPDLTQDEGERARRGQWMVRINGLYADGALDRLEELVQRAEATRPPCEGDFEAADEPGAGDAGARAPSVAEGVAQARARLTWLDAVLRSLQNEYAALEDSPTHALWHALEGGPRGLGLRRHVLAELRADLRREVQARCREVPAAMRAMENAVHQRNQRQLEQALARRQGRAVVAPAFDAHVGQQLMRLSLRELEAHKVPTRVAEWAARLQRRCEAEPALVRLMLLTYVVQLAPGNMPGLERFDELARRFAACGRRERNRVELAEALLQADGLVDYAPHAVAAGGARLQAQLRFRDRAMMQVVPQALRGFGVRRLFAELLAHLGEQLACPNASCGRQVYAVPLFVVRGLDHVRAQVCPRCGEAARSYVLAKGSDVQAVLNAAYLEFELVHEFTVALGQSSVGLQLLPKQVGEMDVRALLTRLRQQLLVRNELDVHPAYLELHQDGRRLAGHTQLCALPHPALRLVLRPQAPQDEAELESALRFRVQTRFAKLPTTNAGH